MTSQVLPQPLILDSMSRQSSGSSKRDSAIGIAVSGGVGSLLQRISLKPGVRRESDSDMAPVYRLVSSSSLYFCPLLLLARTLLYGRSYTKRRTCTSALAIYYTVGWERPPALSVTKPPRSVIPPRQAIRE